MNKEEVMNRLKDEFGNEFTEEQFIKLNKMIETLKQIHGNVPKNTIIKIIRDNQGLMTNIMIHVDNVNREATKECDGIKNKEPLKNKRFCKSKFCD